MTATVPVYAVALSDADGQNMPIGNANNRTVAASLIRKYLRENEGDPDPDVPSSAIVYARGGYWIND